MSTLHPEIEIEIDVSNQNVNLTRREADLALTIADQPDEHLYGRRVGELRYAVFAHRRFFSGDNAPKLEELSWIGFDESLRRVAIARWLATRLPGMRPRLRADSIIAIMHAAAAGIGAAVLPLFAADADRSIPRTLKKLQQSRL